MTEPLLYSCEQASELLGGLVSPRWLREQAAAGRITHRKAGRHRAFTRADIDAVLAQLERGPAAGRRRGGR